MREYKTNKNSFKKSIFIIFAIALISTMVAQLTFLSFFGTKGNEVAALRAKQKDLILENELLEAEISRKQSLVRVKRVASKELGMKNIDEIEYIDPARLISSNAK